MLSIQKHLLLLLLSLRFRTVKTLLLSLRFRTDKTVLLSLHFRTDKTVLLSLHFRTDKIATGRGVLRLSSAISVGVWTPTKKENQNRIHLTTCRGYA